MDFFESQNDSRRQSMFLVMAFSIVFVSCFAVIYLIAGFLAKPLAGLFTSLNASYVLWSIVGALTTVIAWGCYSRWQDVSDGGHQLAKRLGATPVSQHSDDRTHKQLQNLVEEMSVAACVNVPDCFVIIRENSINAFVAGNSDSTVLVVTQGTLTQLDTDELRAVVAHELAHIANHDLSISMKLLIALGGLNAISIAGRACFSSRHLQPEHSTSGNFSVRRGYGQSDAMVTVAFVGVTIVSFVVGTLLCILGCVFSFFGQVLKAAFSRKRELLADAKAVQFTRDKWSVASALNKIAECDIPRGLRSRFSADVAHMCIDSPGGNGLFPSWLATHPPLQTRITSIDPHFQVKYRKNSGVDKNKNDKPTAGAARTVVLPDAGIHQTTCSSNDFAAELSVLFSLIIQSSGYNKETSTKKYESTLKCYTSEPIPMRLANEPGINAELDVALSALIQLPAMQRQNLLDHVAELVDHDGIQVKEETVLLAHIYERLNPSDKAA